MSRDPYAASSLSGSRSPRGARRGELPTVDRSPSRAYPRGSPVGGRKAGRPSRSGNTSPDHAGGGYYGGGQHHMGSPYYRDEDLGSPVMMDDRGRSLGGGGGHHRSRSASRPAASAGGGAVSSRYQSLDRATAGDPDREFMPIREPRERSLDRGGRDRSLERSGAGMYAEDELYGGRSARQSPNPHHMAAGGRDPANSYISELQQQNNDLQRELGNFKRELELTNQKLGSSMHSIKTFWSPELKKERALRKEESAKYSLINDQLKLLNSENQKQAMLVRQLEEDLRMLRMRNPSIEVQQQMEALFAENEHLTREIAILRETIKELELRIETQKQTLQARDESIKKLLEMLQNKGVGGKMLDEERLELEARLIESEARIRHYESLLRERDVEVTKSKRLEEFRAEIQRRDQEILAMSAKMKTLEEQHQDYQRHIAVLKESLCAKEEHYNMLQADVEELRQRLEEKNRQIEKKTLTATQATQDRNRLNNELNELRDHMDIKDRKINVLQRKLDLHEANRKLANGATRAGEETTALKMQLEEQKRQLEDQRRKLEEHKKGVDSKSRMLDEKEKSIAEADMKLKKRKEKLDQLEAQMQKGGGGGPGGDPELRRRLSEMEKLVEGQEKELEKAREDSQRSQVEMERLLQLVQMSQEEQNSKEKQIRDLQEALKNAQTKLRSQQTANAQMEERRRDEADSVAEERIAELEQDVRDLREALLDHSKAEQAGSRRVTELEAEVAALEAALEEQGHLAELEELVGVVRQKNERIEELEEALRESVRITAGREKLLMQEETRRKQIMEKVGKLEQRLLSLQTAHTLRCSTCRPLINRVQDLERRLTQLLAERRDYLQDLASMKQEALEAAISEKDAHLALLEVSGIRTAKQAEQADQLRADRRRLTDKLKEENEHSVRLMQEYAHLDPLQQSPTHSAYADEEVACAQNGHDIQRSEIQPDSLEASSPDAAASS